MKILFLYILSLIAFTAVSLSSFAQNNTVDINSSNPGTSGLRFKQLNNGNIPAINPSNGILSLDSNGKVIWVTAEYSGGLKVCDLPPYWVNTKLTGYQVRWAPFNISHPDSSIICAGQIYDDLKRVGIGTTTMYAKLHVINDEASYNVAIRGDNTLNTTSDGVIGYANRYGLYGQSLAANGFGVYGIMNPSTSISFNAGVYATASNNTNMAFYGGGNYGVYGMAPTNVGNNIGVIGVGRSSVNTNYGVQGRGSGSTAQTSSSMNFGVYGEVLAIANCPASGFAIYGHSENNQVNYGVYGLGRKGTSSNALNNTVSFGVAGYYPGCDGTQMSCGYAVYGNAPSNPSGGCFGNSWAGYFEGNLHYTGTLSGPSDEILKINPQPIDSGLAWIKKMKPEYYTFATERYPSLNLASGVHYGLIAADLQKILPDLVIPIVSPPIYDALGNKVAEAVHYNGVNYIELIPVLIDAVKELNGKVELLQSQLNSCCAASGPTITGDGSKGNGSSNQTVELRNPGQIYLGQNVPNPYSNQTSIPYYIPNDVSKAVIAFYDHIGRTISTVEIIGRGEGQLTTLTSGLEDGVYIYSLLVDDKLIDTKKMVKQH